MKKTANELRAENLREFLNSKLAREIIKSLAKELAKNENTVNRAKSSVVAKLNIIDKISRMIENSTDGDIATFAHTVAGKVVERAIR
jgi:hypothetical protein